jgi:hypothetical protein
MATWHFNGGYRILYAADGKIRAWMGDFIFAEHRVQEGEGSNPRSGEMEGPDG